MPRTVTDTTGVERDSLSPDRLSPLRRALLRWYDREARDLPWRARRRESANAYYVLVSETMLQQTQVATVIDYFNRFIARFPDLGALAAADEQEVLTLWQGLGYYRRASNLHRAAMEIVNAHGGEVPRTVEVLRDLPGVGDYTAGAIASIAFDRPAAILDGNVARVLARWFAFAQAINEAKPKRQLWEMARQCVPKSRPGDFNQAMMELGALICTPREPKCLLCPVAKYCEANQRGRTAELPIVAARRKPTNVTHHVVAIERRGIFLFEQRESTGLWANMWQLPTAEASEPEQLAAWIKERFGLTVESMDRADAFKHQTTHRTIQFVIWHASNPRGRLKRGSVAWRGLSQIEDLPMANPQRRIVQMLRGKDSGD